MSILHTASTPTQPHWDHNLCKAQCRYTNIQIIRIHKYPNIPHTGSTPIQPHWNNRLHTIRKNYISLQICANFTGKTLDQLYIVQSTVCNTAMNNCKNARSQLCAMLRLQSLILSKHVMFDQQSSATSPNIPRTAFWQNTV